MYTCLSYSDLKSNLNYAIYIKKRQENQGFNRSHKLGGKGWKLVGKSVKHGNIINPRDVYHQFMFILLTQCKQCPKK